MTPTASLLKTWCLSGSNLYWSYWLTTNWKNTCNSCLSSFSEIVAIRLELYFQCLVCSEIMYIFITWCFTQKWCSSEEAYLVHYIKSITFHNHCLIFPPQIKSLLCHCHLIMSVRGIIQGPDLFPLNRQRPKANNLNLKSFSLVSFF